MSNQKINNDRKIAYFTIEISLDPNMPTYSGGLGVLAGDRINTQNRDNIQDAMELIPEIRGDNNSYVLQR